MRIILPWPPSVNHYYRYVGSRPLISEEGRAYRETVRRAVRSEPTAPAKPLTSRLGMRVEAHVPDHRGRDIDNLLKPLIDSLAKAGVYANDKQIDDLRIVRKPLAKAGHVIVTLWLSEKLP